MGYWENTTYLACGDTERVRAALVSLFAREGMASIDQPAARKRRVVEPMQYEGALHNDLWGVALVPGAASWTVIKTAPLSLLAERRRGAPGMRLAELCAELAASALHIDVHDSDSLVLAEVSARGEVRLSGFHASGDGLSWHGERLDAALIRPRFQLHRLEGIDLDDRLDRVASALATRLGGDNAASCDNSVCVQTLIEHTPLPAPGGSTLYFRWGGESRVRFTATDSWQEYRAQVGRDAG